MKSPLICLLPVLAFALYPLERARAIAIDVSTTTYIFTVAQSAAAGGYSLDGQNLLDRLPVATSFSPLNGGVTLAASSWDLVQTATEVVWSNAPLLVNLGAVSGYDSRAWVDSELWFWVYEPVNYSVTGSFLTGLGTGAGAFATAYLEKRAGPEYDYQWQGIYGEIDRASGAGFSSLRLGDGQGVFKGAASGVIDPGKYIFNYRASVFDGDGGIGVGNFSFTMTPNVPDGGSTLMLLGLAICAIGGIFRKLKLT